MKTIIFTVLSLIAFNLSAQTEVKNESIEVKSEIDIYVDPRVSAKAKLIAGEALTEDEANTIVL